jgi:uncharacterized protein YraI
MAVLGLSGPAPAQVDQRAQPVTGPGVITIGGIDLDARVNVHSGPSTIFPTVGTLGYGARVRKGTCLGGGSAQWCQIEAVDRSVSGYVRGRYLVEGGSGAREPDYWEVRGLPQGAKLAVRRDPAASSPALATLSEREIVQNRGCRDTPGGRWCRIRSITGMDVTGWVSARYLRESRGPTAIQPPVQPPAGGGIDMHGPDFYVVTGLKPGDSLNVRAQPSTQGAILGRLSAGTRVRNLGCRQTGTSRWCRIQTTGAVELTGWVSGRYLRE